MMTEYETTVVVRPDIGGDAIESTLDRVRDAVRRKNGKLLAINHWGKKKLAYPIKKQTRGIYVHTQYLGEKDLVAEVERNLRISDTVLRFLTIQVAKGVDPASYEEKEYVRPQYEVEETGGGEEAEAAASAEGEAEGQEEHEAEGQEEREAEGQEEREAEGQEEREAAAAAESEVEDQEKAEAEGQQQGEGSQETQDAEQQEE